MENAVLVLINERLLGAFFLDVKTADRLLNGVPHLEVKNQLVSSEQFM